MINKIMTNGASEGLPRLLIDVADSVHHGPSGEDWVVARVTDRHVYPAGWPPIRADLADCTLIEKATEQQRTEMIAKCRLLPVDDARHVADNVYK